MRGLQSIFNDRTQVPTSPHTYKGVWECNARQKADLCQHDVLRCAIIAGRYTHASVWSDKDTSQRRESPALRGIHTCMRLLDKRIVGEGVQQHRAQWCIGGWRAIVSYSHLDAVGRLG